jgi:membrane protein implicated in regulation of membrane protease activity
MNSYANGPRPRGRILVFRLSGRRAGWLARLLVPAALLALIPLAVLVVVGLWAVVAIAAAALAVTALIGAPLLRRLQAKAPQQQQQPRILEGEARRIDVAD